MNLNKFKKHIDKSINGIIQVGAHYGQEVSDFLTLTDNILLFEPQKKAFEQLLKTIEKYDTIKAEQFALGNMDSGDIEMYIANTNDAQSSSLLEPYKHLHQYPNCQFKSKENVKITSINHYFTDKKFNYNLLVIDTQGYELEVLKGGSNYLSKIDFILTEVSNQELYKNCVLIEDLDCFLKTHNFVRSTTDWEGESWGDAIYIKN